ncbi:MAG: hypothetical protein JNK27_00805 [Chitinophagaceae bacterium]|nr:hypothetical protein [Chitinophagaceae bacterium]
MPDRLKRQRFVFLSFVLLAVFIYPIVSIANKIKTIGGIPILFLFIFTAWIIAIFLLYRTAERKNNKPKTNL